MENAINIATMALINGPLIAIVITVALMIVFFAIKVK